MGGEVFQVVWSDLYDSCKRRSELSNAAFLDQLAGVLPYGVDPDIVIDSPTAFPNEMNLVSDLFLGKGILVGEAAHRCHPVGGQGLNLCWRDVYALMILMQKVNSSNFSLFSLPKAYSKRRILDIILVGFCTDSVIRLFSNRNRILLLMRLIIFFFLSRYRLLRKILLSFMTNGPMHS